MTGADVLLDSPDFTSEKPRTAFAAVSPAVADANLRPVLMDGLIASIGSKNRDTVGPIGRHARTEC